MQYANTSPQAARRGLHTLALAAIASQSVDAYGAYIAPALPVRSLTRNLAWAIVVVLGLLVVLNGLGLSITW